MARSKREDLSTLRKQLGVGLVEFQHLRIFLHACGSLSLVSPHWLTFQLGLWHSRHSPGKPKEINSNTECFFALLGLGRESDLAGQIPFCLEVYFII